MTAEFVSTVDSAKITRRPWSSIAVGIYVGTDAVAAVEVDGSSGVRWVLTGPAPADVDAVAASINDLLSQLPVSMSSWRRRRVVIGLDTDYAQFKRLWGLPPIPSVTVGSALLRENASRFFRHSPHGLATSPVVIREADEVWASAADASVVRAVEQSCKTHGVELQALIPMESALEEQTPPEVLTERPSVNAWRLAQLMRAGGPIDFNTASVSALSYSRSPRRERLAAVALATASVLAATLPVLDAQRTVREAQRSHADWAAREATALATVAELEQVDAALVAIARAQSSRRHSIDVIAHLTATLPPGAVITHLQLDSVGGSLTTLAASADGVVKGLSASPLLVQPEIVGPVTRDRSAGKEFDRLSVRFRHPPLNASAAERRSAP